MGVVVPPSDYTPVADAMPAAGTASPGGSAQRGAVPPSDACGARDERAPDRLRVDVLTRALTESQAQCASAQGVIDRLVRRNTRLQHALTELAHRENQVRRLAYRDALTGLANRALLQDRFRQALSQAQRSRRLVALLLIDLDGFKRINDRLGHAAGDRLLQSVAARISASLRGADTACRYGGDEFVIMLPEMDEPATARAVVAKVHARLSEPHLVEGHEICMTASVGTALFPLHGTSCDQLMRHADMAMYRAKAGSGPAVIQAVLDLPQAVVAPLGLGVDPRAGEPPGQSLRLREDAVSCPQATPPPEFTLCDDRPPNQSLLAEALSRMSRLRHRTTGEAECLPSGPTSPRNNA